MLGLTVDNLKCRCTRLESTEQNMEDLKWILKEWQEAPRQRMPRQYFENELNHMEVFYSQKECRMHKSSHKPDTFVPK